MSKITTPDQRVFDGLHLSVGHTAALWTYFASITNRLNGGDAQESVIDKDLTAPPASPVEGARYIIAAVATGLWTGREKSIATYVAATESWFYASPDEGMTTYVEDEDLIYLYNGSAWVAASAGIPAATETSTGVIELATQAETDTGADDARAVTPLKLHTKPEVAQVRAAVATSAGAGDAGKLVELDGAGLFDPSFIPLATETAVGGRELATQAEADAGTDDITIVTPRKLANVPYAGQRLTATTSDAAVTPIYTYTLGDDEAILVEVSVVARQTGGGTAENAYKRMGLVQRRAAGAAALGGAGSVAVYTDEEDLDWDVAVDANANDARVTVTGEVGADIEWAATVRIVNV